MSARIGVAAHAPTSEALHDALIRLAERCEVVAARDGGPFDAVVRSGEDRGDPGEQTLRWVETADTTPARAFVYLAAPETARALRASGLLTVSLGPRESFSQAVPIAPFTRQRIRRARAVVGRAVVREGDAGLTFDGQPVPEGSVATALALCSVLDARTPETALHGAAWQAAVVTTTEVRAATGLPAVAGLDPALDPVEQLLDDSGLLAHHALGCRRTFELDHSPTWSVRRLESLLGVPSREPWLADYSRELARLGTGAEAQIRVRAADAVAALRRPR